MTGLGNCGKFNTKEETKETSEKKEHRSMVIKRKKEKVGRRLSEKKGWLVEVRREAARS